MSAVERGGRSKQPRKRWATGAPPPSPFIAREGQPAPPTIAGNDGFPCMSQGLVKSGSCRGSVGKRRRPRPINHHASTEAAGYWGPRRSALDPWLRLEAKPKRASGPGLLSAFWERGSPDFPACGPWRGFAGRPVRPIFINKELRPSRGVRPRKADDTRPPQEQPHQAGS